MKIIPITALYEKSQYYNTNQGEYLEQSSIYTLTGKIQHHDNIPFDKGSDIQEFAISVKTSGFTLCSGGMLKGETMEEMLNDFFQRVHSKSFLYVSAQCVGYLMNKTEFREYLEHFTRLERESQKNGGQIKIRARKESQKMLKWLDAQI